MIKTLILNIKSRSPLPPISISHLFNKTFSLYSANYNVGQLFNSNLVCKVMCMEGINYINLIEVSPAVIEI